MGKRRGAGRLVPPAPPSPRLPPVDCYFIEPVDRAQLSLRRYAARDLDPQRTCEQSGLGYHNAAVKIETAPHQHGEAIQTLRRRPNGDPRWPTHCACGYAFRDDDYWQLDRSRLYHRADTGEERLLEEFGPGAMYYADWMVWEGSKRNRGPDGRALVIICPTRDGSRGTWLIDGQASNCTMPCKNCDRPYSDHWARSQGERQFECPRYEGVDQGDHRCWVRHGDPRTGKITVDKSGNTCGAGAGSIMIGGWHGHLVHGQLIEC
jgi:hypothetical protein